MHVFYAIILFCNRSMLRYFTTWCLILYGLRALGLVPYNVLLLTIAVLVGAAMINLTINEHYHMGIDFVTHYVPFLLALKYESWDSVYLTEGISFFVAYLFIYLVYNKFDFDLLREVYRKPNCLLKPTSDDGDACPK